MAHVVDNFLKLFFISSPASAVAILLALTARHSVRQRIRAAALACAVAICVLFCVVCSGPLLFRFFGISLQAFKIAGGLFLVYVGFVTVFGGSDPGSAESDGPPPGILSFAITPLAVPLICGPGIISTVLLLGEDLPGIFGALGLCLSILLAIGSLFICLGICAKCAERIPPFALTLATKLTGIYVIALGTLIFCSGLSLFLAHGGVLV
ncbi:MAG: MarC family protein [Puniceicoccales bacterium]|jgi:multiple antibiotic resistance protein|nr:MarC family protein [Puniceicoccales bacterium]